MIIQVAAIALLVFVAGFLLWPIVKAARRQARRGGWHPVTGTVLGHLRREVPGGAFAEFRVRYEAGGMQREETVGSADGLPFQYQEEEHRARMDAVVAKYHKKYPVGSPIPLRVDPGMPTRAHVRAAEMPMAVIAVVVALAFAGFIAIAVKVMF